MAQGPGHILILVAPAFEKLRGRSTTGVLSSVNTCSSGSKSLASIYFDAEWHPKLVNDCSADRDRGIPMGKGERHESAEEHLPTSNRAAEKKDISADPGTDEKRGHDRDWMADVLANRFLMILYR
jgi:hypothetical protein